MDGSLTSAVPMAWPSGSFETTADGLGECARFESGSGASSIRSSHSHASATYCAARKHTGRCRHSYSGAYRRFATTFVRNPIVTKTRLKAAQVEKVYIHYKLVDRLASKLLGQPSSRVALFATVIVLALTCTGGWFETSLAPAVDPLGCEAQLRLDTLLERLHVLELLEARVLERERRFHSLEQQEAIVLERERRLEALQRELSSQQRQLDIATAKKRERPATHSLR